MLTTISDGVNHVHFVEFLVDVDEYPSDDLYFLGGE